MKIVIAGGTGLLGTHLTTYLLQQQHSVCILTRAPIVAKEGARTVLWDAQTLGAWVGEIDGAHAVINLTGKNILTRWNSAAKRQILASRIGTTNLLTEAILHVKAKPAVFLSASAVGYYGNTGDDTVLEHHTRGNGFLADVCAQWEEASQRVHEVGVRVVNPRIGVVLARGGGALQPLYKQFSLFAGGYIGSGEQFFPWVHISDLVLACVRCLEDATISGACNITAPNPVRMKEFASALGAVLHRPSWLHTPAFVLRLALGEAAAVLLDSQRALPGVLLHKGFAFRFPIVQEALRDVLMPPTERQTPQ